MKRITPKQHVRKCVMCGATYRTRPKSGHPWLRCPKCRKLKIPRKAA